MITRVDVGIFFMFLERIHKKSPCEMLQLSQGVKNKTFSDIAVIIMEINSFC